MLFTIFRFVISQNSGLQAFLVLNFRLSPKHLFTSNFCFSFLKNNGFQAFFVFQISKTLVYKHFQNLSSLKKKSGLKNQKRAIHKLQKREI